MTKKSIALVAVYVLSLIACFTIAFIDVLSNADGNGVIVGYKLPCVKTVTSCPSCSAFNSVDPPNSQSNILPPTWFEEPCEPDDDLVIGERRLIGVRMVLCYEKKDCIVDPKPKYAHRCDIYIPCVFCEDNLSSICYEVKEDETIIIATYEKRIWKPTSEDM